VVSSGDRNANASAHVAAQAGVGRWQLRSSAGQANTTWSWLQPGRAAHSTGTQRERVCSMTGSDAAATGGAAGVGGSEGGGVVVQAESVPRIRALQMLRARDRQSEGRDMWLILLEALGALLILIFIVWWTMFSGRKDADRRDEPPPADDDAPKP
jgi:hypothetical protein